MALCKQGGVYGKAVLSAPIIHAKKKKGTWSQANQHAKPSGASKYSEFQKARQETGVLHRVHFVSPSSYFTDLFCVTDVFNGYLYL